MLDAAPALVLPRTAPCEEPVNIELPENEVQFDSSIDELIDPADDVPVMEFPELATRGPDVRAPIYATPESRPERTLPRKAREQIASQNSGPATAPLGDDPFAELMGKFGK